MLALDALDDEYAEVNDWPWEYGVGDVDGGVGSWAWGVLGGRASGLAPRELARDLRWEISERRDWHSWDLAENWACCEVRVSMSEKGKGKGDGREGVKERGSESDRWMESEMG